MDTLNEMVTSALSGPCPVDNRAVSSQLQNDLFQFIAQTYSSFECALFRAKSGTYKEETKEEADSERVGRLEQKEVKISYQGMDLVRAVEYPKDMQGRLLTDSGLTSDDELYEDTLLMLFSVSDVPEQSIVIYNEMIADDTAKLTALYVLEGKPVGKHALAGKVYHCIPLRGDIGDILSGEEKQQGSEATLIEPSLHNFFDDYSP